MMLKNLQPRERRLVIAALCIIALALLWWVAIAPALHTYRHSTSAHAQLDAQIAKMQALANQAQALKALPSPSNAKAKEWLDSNAKKLSTNANVAILGNQAQMRFQNVQPQALVSWLAEARSSAGLRVLQASWNKTSSAVGTLAWSGDMALEMPQ
jgi:general secretion pathway protein M